MTRKPALSLALLCFVFCSILSGAVFGQGYSPAAPVAFRTNENVLDSMVTIQIVTDGSATPVGSGVVVRSDGLILTALNLVKGAPALSIRLRSGETFDHAEIVATDERRNIAVLRIPAANLTSLANSVLEEGAVGTTVATIATNAITDQATGLLSSVTLADEIPGAGSGFRVLKFTAPYSAGQIGGVLIDAKGSPLGLLAPAPNAQNQNYAVPLSSLVGLTRSIGFGTMLATTASSSASTQPYPILQSSVMVPQRPVTPLSAKGPGSVVIKSTRPVDILLESKTIYVDSYTENFKPDQLVNELTSKTEFNNLGLSFVDEREVADLVLTLDHIVFTWKFTFKLVHQRTGVVVAAGDVIIWDGNLGAPHMANRIMEKLTKVRAQVPTPAALPAAPENKGAAKAKDGGKK
jgi:hypothetical protein